jgi:hypothetical protein
MLERMSASPVPTYRTLGSEAATASAPMVPIGWASKIGAQVRPASRVSHTPPFTEPK